MPAIVLLIQSFVRRGRFRCRRRRGLLPNYQGPSDWTTSTRLSASASFEFQTSDLSRVLALHVGV